MAHAPFKANTTTVPDNTIAGMLRYVRNVTTRSPRSRIAPTAPASKTKMSIRLPAQPSENTIPIARPPAQRVRLNRLKRSLADEGEYTESTSRPSLTSYRARPIVAHISPQRNGPIPDQAYDRKREYARRGSILVPLYISRGTFRGREGTARATEMGELGYIRVSALSRRDRVLAVTPTKSNYHGRVVRRWESIRMQHMPEASTR